MERPTFRRMIQSAKDDSNGDPDRQVALPRGVITNYELR